MFKYLCALIFISVCACKVTHGSNQDRWKIIAPGRIGNLDSKTPVVWRADDDGRMNWHGDYATAVDTIMSIDINTLREVEVVKYRVLRLGKWVLKDEEGNLYAEAAYNWDTLTSITRHLQYPAKYDSIDSRLTDTLSVLVKY